MRKYFSTYDKINGEGEPPCLGASVGLRETKRASNGQ